MNDPDYSMNDPLKLTVAEYAKRFNMSENTVRTRINRRKLKTVKEVVDTRETILILVEPSVDHSKDSSEQSEVVQGIVEDHSPEQGEQPGEQSEPSTNNPPNSEKLLEIVQQAFSEIKAYNNQIGDLRVENAQYKLITENSSKTLNDLEQEVEQLKDQIFERDALIKQLEIELATLKASQKPGWKFWGK